MKYVSTHAGCSIRLDSTKFSYLFPARDTEFSDKPVYTNVLVILERESQSERARAAATPRVVSRTGAYQQ